MGRVPRGCWGHGLLPGPSACVPAATVGDRFHVLLHDSPFCGPPPSLHPPHWDPSGQHKELNAQAGGTKGNPGQASGTITVGSTRVLCPCSGVVSALACSQWPCQDWCGAWGPAEPPCWGKAADGSQGSGVAVSHTVAPAPGAASPSSSVPHGADSICPLRPVPLQPQGCVCWQLTSQRLQWLF